VKETAFLLKSGLPVYSFEKVLPAPLLLRFIELVESMTRSPLAIQFGFILLDFLIGFQLAELTGSQYMLLVHLLNPVSIMTCLGKNLSLFSLALIVAGLSSARKGQKGLSASCLALASYLDVRNGIFAIPAYFWIRDVRFIALNVLFLSILFATNAFVWSPASFESVYWSRLRVDDLRPNAGLFWYFYQEIFAHFSQFMKVVFHLVSAALIASFSIKFEQDPLFLAFVLQAATTILKPDPSGADYVFLCGLLFAQSHVFEYTRVLFIALFVQAGIFVFLLRIWDYWIRFNGFNVNFYFIFTLAWNVVWVVITLEMVLAYQRSKIYEAYPFLKEKEFEKCKLIQR
jgi:phosphatidylinositol glycan class U